MIVSSVSCMALLLVAASCGEEAGANNAQSGAARAATTQPIPVTLAPVDRTPIPATVDFVGTLYGDEEAAIASKVSGRIVQVVADLGDRVEDDGVLARVDPTDYELYVQQRDLALREALAKLGLEQLPNDNFDLTTIATVRRASVQAENAKARLERARQLFEQDPPLISPQEYADTQTQFEVARQDYDVALLDVRSALAQAQSRAAELAVSRQQLRDTVIRAPVSMSTTTRPAVQDRWAVAERRTNVGEYVESGTVVYRLIADQPIKLRTSLPERFLGQVAPEQEATLRVDSLAQAIGGTVSRVSPAVDVASRTFAVEITFANADRALKSGSFGRGAITVGTRSDVTTVPAAALYSFAGQNRVFTVKDGKAVAHNVNVLRRDDDRVVVEGDLAGAAEAIVGGLARLANGTPVTATPATTRPAR